MRIASHLSKFKRFDECRAKLDPLADFELWFWMGLSAGTTIVNAALHAAGITEENDYFAGQIPDVYVAAADGGTWQQKLAVDSDIIHVGFLRTNKPLPPALVDAFSAMEVIEHYRDPCVRGEEPITPKVIGDCDTAYRKVVALTRQIIETSTAPA